MAGYSLPALIRSGIRVPYVCSHCKLLPRDVMQTACGHLYCLSCLDSITIDDQVSVIKCCEDGELIDRDRGVFCDTFRRNEISAFMVRFLCVPVDCDWKGGMESYQMRVQNCKYRQVRSTKQKKSALKEYLKGECECRLQKCDKSGNAVKLNNKELTSRGVRQQNPDEDVVSRIFRGPQVALNLSGDVESVTCHSPGLASRSPSTVPDSENAPSETLRLFNMIQGIVQVTKDLTTLLRQQQEWMTAQDERIAALEMAMDSAPGNMLDLSRRRFR